MAVTMARTTTTTTTTTATMATNDKYDRQLRLWGAQGQRALGETRVISVGASSAGTETLKNLVLPGVGAFTVMDFVDETAAAAAAAAALDGDNCSDNNSSNSNGRSSPSSVATTGKITDHDVSSNFFLTKENATKAEGAYKHLKELNPDVSGSYRNITVSLNAASNKEEGPDTPGYWKRILEEEFLRGEETETEATESGEADTAMEAEAKLRPKNLLVVASDVLPSILEALADACWEAGHPLIVVISYGLIGSVRLQLPKKGAVLLQPKPTSSPPDLRLVTSFPAFREFVDSVVGGDSLQQMDSQQHGHVPYPVLLAKAIDNYHETKSKEAIEGGNCNSNSNNQRILPKSFAEKRDFVNNYVKPMARDYNLQLNFQEAVSNAYLAYTEQDIGWKDSPTNISKESKLGQLESALETFIREHPDHRPPLNGSVPDMTASTALYVRLQQLYRDQAEEDLKIMTEILRNTQEQQERDGNGGAAGALESVTDDDIANFCANVYSVGHIKTRSLLEEYHGSASSNDNNNDNNDNDNEHRRRRHRTRQGDDGGHAHPQQQHRDGNEPQAVARRGIVQESFRPNSPGDRQAPQRNTQRQQQQQQQQQDDDDDEIIIISKIEANDMIETTNQMITANTATGSSDEDDNHKRLRVLESSVFEKLFAPPSL
mmetsp:Transcript_12071/g.24558  ORF Transcript_12071/g.24558 Transcript_12071/m.24558 type:complete len:660 (+) Transcript_12071:2-1981(+)